MEIQTKITILLFAFIVSNFNLPENNITHSFTAEQVVDKEYIPADLNDCMDYLDKLFSEETKESIKNLQENKFTAACHFSIGMWMRNNWGLWGMSRLSYYFRNLGIDHADDMSGIILTSYYRRLNGIEIDLNKQIEYYQEYWKNTEGDIFRLKEPEEAFEPEKNYVLDTTVVYLRDHQSDGEVSIYVKPGSKYCWMSSRNFGLRRVKYKLAMDFVKADYNKEKFLDKALNSTDGLERMNSFGW